MVIGILALQGCVEPHAEHLRSLGISVRYVRLPSDLDGINGLILPGGESTTMLKLARVFGVWEKLLPLSMQIPFWGICAGSILMATQVENPEQESLGVMDLTVRRNAYGRQLESFQGNVDTDTGPEAAVFIRAPKFTKFGSTVKVAGRVNGEAVFLEEGRHRVTAFHPEMTDSNWCHQRFLAKISANTPGL